MNPTRFRAPTYGAYEIAATGPELAARIVLALRSYALVKDIGQS